MKDKGNQIIQQRTSCSWLLNILRVSEWIFELHITTAQFTPEVHLFEVPEKKVLHTKCRTTLSLQPGLLLSSTSTPALLSDFNEVPNLPLFPHRHLIFAFLFILELSAMHSFAETVTSHIREFAKSIKLFAKLHTIIFFESWMVFQLFSLTMSC